MTQTIGLTLLLETFSVCRLSASSATPSWATEGSFYSVVSTSEELSVVCESRLVPDSVPDSVKQERSWRCLRVDGVLDFSLSGILASLLAPLAEAQVPIFAVSSFNTDYILFKEENLEKAMTALIKAGFGVKTG